ncbi:MAG: FlgD immunoglobulin-like domain containing protein [Candidatus Kariarchaeaceae archaeon]|jgi:flagellar hook assembly protein FlgD
MKPEFLQSQPVNYPNPFNPETAIRFQLPEAATVVVRIYDLLGKEVRGFLEGQYEAGFHALSWDAMDNNGNPVPSGIYLYQLQAGSFSQVRKMTLLR